MRLIPSASVIVCTRDRATQLTVALAGLAEQVFDPALSWEVVVVDNGSSDDTQRVVRDWAPNLPVPLHYLNEPVPGLSAARNHGWRESRGEISAFLDDDCRPEPGWLQALVDTYDAPEIASVTGRLLPHIEPSEGEHIDPVWRASYTFDHGSARRDIRRLSGANMSFRRSTLEATGGFDESLGRVGSCLLAGDENQMGDALLRQPKSLRIVYQPKAFVTHALRADTLSEALLLKRSYCGGISNAIIDAKAAFGTKIARWLGRSARMFWWALRVLYSLLPGAHGNPLRLAARRQEFVGYTRQQSGGIEAACHACPRRNDRERRLSLLNEAADSAARRRQSPNSS